MGKLSLFLGVEFIDKVDGFCLTHHKYCLELLHEFGKLGCKPVNTPLDMNVVISENGLDEKDSLLINITEYQNLIGKLI